MARLVLWVATFLLVHIGSAELTPEAYWNHALPHTAMPAVLRDYLNTGVEDQKATSVGVGGDGVVVRAPGTGVNVGPPGVFVHAPGRHHRPVVVRAPYGPFLYNYAASEDQLKDPSVALFFREEDLKPGHKMDLIFTKTAGSGPRFLPRATSHKLPFSSEMFSDILSEFSIRPDSNEASLMKHTIEECELPSNKGETRLCATSLEAMIDFSTSELHTHDVRVLATAVRSQEERPTKMTYSILGGVEKVKSQDAVVCHNEPYPYAVFYCHKTSQTRSYVVQLVSDGGNRVDAVAVCHVNTASWNPKHIAFRVLGVEPGTVPVCHFLPQDHLVWVPSV